MKEKSSLCSNKFKALSLAGIVLGLISCAEVKPWQKENLAKPHMAFEPDSLETKFVQHVYQSKEGSSGGYGLGGGGCGCN